MIRAVLWTEGKRVTAYELSGHSGYAEAGSDIVCSAASVLAITCANSLESVCGIHPTVAGGEDGYLKVSLPSAMTERQRHDAQVILCTLRQGLRDLVESYPKYVQLSIVNGGKNHDETQSSALRP